MPDDLNLISKAQLDAARKSLGMCVPVKALLLNLGPLTVLLLESYGDRKAGLSGANYAGEKLPFSVSNAQLLREPAQHRRHCTATVLVRSDLTSPALAAWMFIRLRWSSQSGRRVQSLVVLSSELSGVCDEMMKASH